MRKPTGRPNGRPRFEPTDEQRKNVAVLVGLGITEVEICGVVRDQKDHPVTVPTLRRHFKRELEAGAVALNGRVGNFMIATIFGQQLPEGFDGTAITDEKSRTRLLELFAKTRMGMGEQAKLKVEGDINVNVTGAREFIIGEIDKIAERIFDKE